MHDADYYALLGVDRSSPPEEITRAYRRLARQYHPDVNPHDTEAGNRFKEINEAYQVLSEPEKRAQYDLQLASSEFPRYPASSPAGLTQDEQPIAPQQPAVVDWQDVQGAIGDLASTVEEVANQAADELREALHGFGAQLDALSRTLRDTAGGDRTARHGFPPPPLNNRRPPRGGKPPSHGRPPRDGRAPRP